MERKEFSHILQSGQIVKGKVFSLATLSAKFQVWARAYGLDDETSLACWIANQPEKHKTYFSGEEEVLTLAERGFAKIKGMKIPDLS